MPVVLLGLLFLTGVLGCQPQNEASPAQTKRAVVEVVATDSSLQTTSSVPSGWITFRMRNEGATHHSFKMRKLPPGKTIADIERGLYDPADSLEALLVEGRIDSATYGREMGQRVPAWFPEETTVVGGITGLAPGRTAQITQNLPPGHYALSCLFQTPEGHTHALLGVRSGLTVTEDSSGAQPPEADVTARLSHTSFDVDTAALSDEQTVAFRSEGGPNGNGSPFVGLFRLTRETDAAKVVSWMEEGIPLPAPTEWIGGPEPMPDGNVAYVDVGVLPAGRYAWIAETAPDTTGMVKPFIVREE